MDRKHRVLIMGAAGRDFHNFNLVYRGNPDVEVVAFTAAQIPGIYGKVYPAVLAGELYPKGIRIFSEDDLAALIHEHRVAEVVFSYSDVPYQKVMQKAALVNSCGAKFSMLGAIQTMIKSNKPVVAICATRTGCGKSQVTRKVCQILKAMGRTAVPIRHPMPYGDLAEQAVQRFATLYDLNRHHCTIEEMEEYEPHIAENRVIYAGVDYGAILRQAEEEADIIVWDGGNNDTSFYVPDLLITVVDPLRLGHEVSYYPGQVNLITADVVVINKADSTTPGVIAQLRETIRQQNPKAVIIVAASPVKVDDPGKIAGKRVLVVEDGPTLTHGEMLFGAGTVAANKFGASKIVDPRPFLRGSLADTFQLYPNIGTILPAMGYSPEQVADLRATIIAAHEAGAIDSVVIGTPIDLARVIELPIAAVRVSYDLMEIGTPTLKEVIQNRFSA